MASQRTDEWYRERACELFHKDGEIEIDGGAEVSRNDSEDSSAGAYVKAWVWVADGDE